MMETGSIVLIPFPFAEKDDIKVRPCSVICVTQDKYQDLVVSAISSVVPLNVGKNDIVLEIDSLNGLRKRSVLKVDRIVTIKKKSVIANLGRLSVKDSIQFKEKFKKLID